jgi:hypothetical protein
MNSVVAAFPRRDLHVILDNLNTHKKNERWLNKHSRVHFHFEPGLVPKQVIEAAIQSILVDLLVAELKQIAKCRATIPVLGNMQLARRLAQPRRYQHRRRLRPCDAFPARRNHT